MNCRVVTYNVEYIDRAGLDMNRRVVEMSTRQVVDIEYIDRAGMMNLTSGGRYVEYIDRQGGTDEPYIGFSIYRLAGLSNRGVARGGGEPPRAPG